MKSVAALSCDKLFFTTLWTQVGYEIERQRHIKPENVAIVIDSRTVASLFAIPAVYFYFRSTLLDGR